MNEKQNYGAEDLAGDLERFGEEIANDTERTIDETHPRNFRREDWTAMLEAVQHSLSVPPPESPSSLWVPAKSWI